MPLLNRSAARLMSLSQRRSANFAASSLNPIAVNVAMWSGFACIELMVLMTDDAEFDLIAAANPEPAVRAATVFQPRTGHADGTEDHFRAGVTHGTVSEMVDSRISVFTEMGFTVEEATEALRRCNNDVNDALTMLLSK